MTRAVLLLIAAAACYPTTTRPNLTPQPGATVVELELFMDQATRELALALDADSVPIRRTEPRDGWLESEWFDSRTMQATGARLLGPHVVKVRAFVEPSKANHTIVTIETVYRPFADPSRDDRDLERQVPPNHPVAVRINAMVARLAAQHGEPAALPAGPPAAATPPDTTKPPAEVPAVPPTQKPASAG